MIDVNEPALQEEIAQIYANKKIAKAFEDFGAHANVHRNNPDFAILSTATFGTKALHELAPAEVYGKNYPKIVLEGLRRDAIIFKDGNLPIFPNGIDQTLREKIGLKPCEGERPSILAERLNHIVQAEELSEKLSSQLKQKPQRTQTMKI